MGVEDSARQVFEKILPCPVAVERARREEHCRCQNKGKRNPWSEEAGQHKGKLLDPVCFEWVNVWGVTYIPPTPSRSKLESGNSKLPPAFSLELGADSLQLLFARGFTYI